MSDGEASSASAADRPPEAPGASAPGAFVVLAAAAVGGAGVMGVELAAVRLIAPWFGSSLTVWTNVLGTILAALSLGYLAGARLASGERPAARLALALGVAGALTAILPWVADGASALFLPETLALADALEVLTWGSLATSAVLFLPPAVVLGAIGPLAVEALQRRRGGHAGAAGGIVLALSTLGSLAGTFLTTHYALPELGLARTFASLAAILAGAGLLLWLADRRAHASAFAVVAALVGAAVTAAFGPDPARAIGRDDGSDRALLAVRDSPYQRVRVVEDPSAAPVTRRLEVNERSDSFQSVWQAEPGLLPAGYYYNDFALPPWWAASEAGAAPERWRVLLLGLGGGTAWRVLTGAAPAATELSGDGVELDPAVVALARAHLDLPGAGAALAVHGDLDARAALRALPGPYDQVVLDTYSNQVEIPPHLGSEEFYAELRARLAPGGWLTVNVGAFGLDDPLVDAVGASLARAFDAEVLALRVPAARNVTLVARRGAPLPDLGEALGDPALDALLEPRRVPGTTRVIGAGDAGRLTDDRSPLLALQRASLRDASGRELPGAAAGRAAVTDLGPEWNAGQLADAIAASRRYEAAGALEQAYACAALGLELAPSDLELELRAGAVALALNRPRVAGEHLDRLAAGLEAAALAPEAADWWRARLEDNRAWFAAEVAAQRARAAAARRGRRTSLAILAAAVLVGAVVAPRRRR